MLVPSLSLGCLSPSVSVCIFIYTYIHYTYIYIYCHLQYKKYHVEYIWTLPFFLTIYLGAVAMRRHLDLPNF